MELKQPTTYDEQITILKSRNLSIENECDCRKTLEWINYYRFSAYLLPFYERETGTFSNVSFLKIQHIYEFDRKMRGILFSAIEEVEVFFRAKIAYYHGHKYGAEGYMIGENFNKYHNAEKFAADFKREVESNKRASCVKHHNEQYGGRFPIWAAVELFTFGMTSRFFSDLKLEDQKTLARNLCNTTPKNVKSWLRCCTDLRNICAHYGRLYYRVFPAVPAGLDMPDTAKRRLWGAVSALKNLYPSVEKWNRDVVPAVMNLVEEYYDDIALYHIAFPRNWGIQLIK